jgi:hypothetical protein
MVIKLIDCLPSVHFTSVDHYYLLKKLLCVNTENGEIPTPVLDGGSTFTIVKSRDHHAVPDGGRAGFPREFRDRPA